MNIFAVHNCPEQSARMLNDKHIPKMPTESAQILSTVVSKYMQYDLGYRPTHANHPNVLWAAESRSNFIWLIKHAEAMLDEHVRRFKRIKHATPRMVISAAKQIVNEITFPKDELTIFAQGFKLKAPHCLHENPIFGYRQFYIYDKLWMGWKYTPAPDWVSNNDISNCPEFKTCVLTL